MYYSELCDPLQVFWRLGENTELTNPKKYMTTVSETRSDGCRTLRQVETEIFDLSDEDSGRYRCVAYCRGEERAVGPVSEVYVKGKM